MKDGHGYGFPDMADVVPEGTVGVASVAHFEISETRSRMSAWKGGRQFVEPGRYASLRVRGDLVMSDTRMERQSNTEVVRHARGAVLIAGLGLGMILQPILRKPEVEHVTVVEREPDVVALIAPTLPKTRKLDIVVADIFAWRPPKGAKFDAIYFDVWADAPVDEHLAQIAQLHQAFKGYKRPGGWMGSWDQEWLRYQRRRGY